MKDYITCNNGVFTLSTKNTTYQMMTDKFKNLIHLYYGKKTEGVMDFLLYMTYRPFSEVPDYTGSDRSYSLDDLPQEFPARGTGDQRSCCVDVKYADTGWGLALHVKDYKITEEKYSIPNLPAVYQNPEEDASSLEITLYDDVTDVEVKLLYGVIPDRDIITRSAVIKNCGKEKISVEKFQACCLDFLDGSFDLVKFYGRWAMERNIERTPVTHFESVISARRGCAGHTTSPFAVLCEHDANENYGNCWGASFAYSGNFKIEASMNQYNQTRFQIGLNDEMFSYPLESGMSLYSPEVILSFSSEGLSGLSHNFHDCLKNNVVRGKFKNKVRPVLINSWEAAYFDFNADSLLKLADQAAGLGVEMFVMDDGWFGHRNDDTSSLGDWVVNEKKLGCTLDELVKKINAKGLKFGIWFEPEMISEDSDLYRAHPDYVLCFKGRSPARGRGQLVLDFSRPEVVDCIYNQMCAILDSTNIEYVKWDFNRNIVDVYSKNAQDQGKVLYDYVLGLYGLLDRLTKKYPDILFEGCSGGGGRFDAGMLYYTPQIWTSDNTDALDRTYIQYGTSFGFPVNMVGAHVSICPNHMTQRTTPIHTRGVVAMSGTFGYELNLSQISEEEKEEIKKQIVEFKETAPLIYDGDYYRLTDPFENDVASWMFVSKDKKLAAVSYVVKDFHGFINLSAPVYLKLSGLKENGMYREVKTGAVYPAAALMQCGYPVKDITQVYQADMIRFELV